MIILRNQLNKDLVNYINREIFPEYSKFDKAHDSEHVEEVINNSIKYSKFYKVDPNMVYTIAAYHDLGLKFGRDNHETNSKNILLSDGNLKKWFSNDEIKVMADAVEDHRASLEYEPRSIYGKIISEADRVIDPERTIERTIKFNLSNFPNESKEQTKERVYNYLLKKYSKTGYIKLWIPKSGNKEKIKRFQTILDNKILFDKIFEKIYNKYT